MRIELSLLLFLAVTAAAIAQPQKMDAKAVRARLKGEWREYDVRATKEEQYRKSFGLQWSIFQPGDPGSSPNRTSLTDHNNESTQTHGELILNTEVDPMWLDFRFPDNSGDMVQVGILRFEGEHPRWVLNKEWVRLDVYERAKGKVRERPTAFEDDKKQPIGYRLEPFTFGRD